ncbi:MAG: FAD-binding oxidoreductase [Comamonadaceae bacterium]|nr:FAD-binding oxidoreductase [Comamonadaceae bacterium]
MSKNPIPIAARRPQAPPGGLGLDLSEIEETLDGQAVVVDDRLIQRLHSVCDDVSVAHHDLADASRDWWPLGMVWATTGRVARKAGVVVRPKSVEEISAVLRLCNESGVPVTASGGRSGVLGNSLPVFGGVSLDCTNLSGILDLRADDLTVDVRAGTFFDALEASCQSAGYTVGHWPQSVALATVGGSIACRGAGQMSTRYGTMADITKSVTAVLADGRVIETSEYSHSATGPDLTQLFVGSEGTLGVITSARLHVRPKANYQASAAFAFDSFAAGVEAIGRFARRGAAPAVVRLYDDVESRRNFATVGKHVLILHDEGEAALIEGAWKLMLSECTAAGGVTMDKGLVEQWLGHRNNVRTIDTLIEDRAPDTMEVTAPWSRLVEIYNATTAAISAVDGSRTATAHISHVYPYGAGLYFMFGGRPEVDKRPLWYRETWNAAARAALAAGANLSHHHGIGLGRGRFMSEALGGSYHVLSAVKRALDPKGILNPGKLGLDSPFGVPPEWEDRASIRR